MQLKTSRIFSALALISVSTACFLLFWERLSNVSWTVSGKIRPRLEGRFSGGDDLRGSSHAAADETPMPVLSTESFSRPPRWDFEDIYSLDAPPRRTPCVRSVRNSDAEGFREAFLPAVRLFLHRDNINVSEWNRLSHFNNPFGFMGYRYDDVMPSVMLIPEPRHPLLPPPKPGGDRCVRCAVVGTGGILGGSKMGKEIDAHDHVFRMNGAVIKGYEDDVGTRTSVYVHTAHSITTSRRLLRAHGHAAVPNDEGIRYAMIPEGTRDFYWLRALLKGEQVAAGPHHKEWPRMYYGGQFNESRFYVLHQDFLRYVKNRFLKSALLNSTYWSYFRPTSGAFTLFLALHTCDTVSAYGFMTDDYEKYSNYYYEKNKTEVVFYISHDLLLEKDVWKKLHNSNIIRLYQRTQTEDEWSLRNV
ncbi:alpha-N-acetylgalactosaminide alpha-2,6-sialyltransferase 1.1 [Brachionichthys hirsutus]|uniref:alpha-N-acetylgalactosaminide alpha-2,6-sialyltransferase 1.1 n=1 Tax=Brachionichthys hirsutus TaxID=412623 RepID=UPI003604F7D7